MSIGFGRLDDNTIRKYTGEFKLKVVEELRQNNLSYKGTARKYKLSDTLIAKWERIYLEEGPEGMYLERRGRATKDDNFRKKRQPKFDKKHDEGTEIKNKIKEIFDENKKRVSDTDVLLELE